MLYIVRPLGSSPTSWH